MFGGRTSSKEDCKFRACGFPFLTSNVKLTVSPTLNDPISKSERKVSLPKCAVTAWDAMKPKCFSGMKEVIVPTYRVPSWTAWLLAPHTPAGITAGGGIGGTSTLATFAVARRPAARGAAGQQPLVGGPPTRPDFAGAAASQLLSHPSHPAEAALWLVVPVDNNCEQDRVTNIEMANLSVGHERVLSEICSHLLRLNETEAFLSVEIRDCPRISSHGLLLQGSQSMRLELRAQRDVKLERLQHIIVGVLS
eukprot:CAMPEP_0115258676 /NCGR_PEP_ID=MMETSP0270-20121206/47422_1 /TAXON_ID=71861 /ORGANISM="Scrippsiella trochoidea, Strain CCMP3099" /LENGTH=249 /DNA_ID=CAMNT_0002674443 /DNA_START=473 /DNA_END=1224 /DNA_ORIENTATION=-